MAERKRKQDTEIEVTDNLPDVVDNEPKPVPEVPDDFLGEPVNQEEFNEHVKSLVGLFFEQKVAGLEQRITDLEMVVGAQAHQKEPTQDTEFIRQVPAPGIPEYRPPSEGDGSGSGTPWYRG